MHVKGTILLAVLVCMPSYCAQPTAASAKPAPPPAKDLDAAAAASAQADSKTPVSTKTRLSNYLAQQRVKKDYGDMNEVWQKKTVGEGAVARKNVLERLSTHRPSDLNVVLPEIQDMPAATVAAYSAAQQAKLLERNGQDAPIRTKLYQAMVVLETSKGDEQHAAFDQLALNIQMLSSSLRQEVEPILAQHYGFNEKQFGDMINDRAKVALPNVERHVPSPVESDPHAVEPTFDLNNPVARKRSVTMISGKSRTSLSARPKAVSTAAQAAGSSAAASSAAAAATATTGAASSSSAAVKKDDGKGDGKDGKAKK